jgi:outer membrane protein assembly factor BamB
MKRPTVLFFIIAFGLFGVSPDSVAQPGGESPKDWPQFRGPDSIPVSANPNLPSRWSKSENVEWATDIPGTGWSSPIVWGGKVFVTSAVGNKPMKQPSLGVDFSNDYVAELQKQGLPMEEVIAKVTGRDNEMPDEIELKYRLFCLDLSTGNIVWDGEIFAGPPPVGRHRKNSYTSETPVTDGKAVYVYIGHLGLFAFDFAGTQLWSAPLEAHQVYLDFGSGSSPALYKDKVFILSDNEEASFIAAFDKNTGKKLWDTKRPGLGTKMTRSGWSTPFVWQNEHRTEVVTIGPGVVISYDLDGTELWRMSRMAAVPIQSPFSWGGLLYVTSGSGGEIKPIVAIRPGGSGDITPPESKNSNEHVAWYNRTAGGTYLPTPLIYEGGLYVLTNTGIFTKYDPKTGERVYRSRIDPRATNFTSSPWAYDGKIFVLNEEGHTFVIKAGDTFELLGINSLDDFSMATPAISGDRLLIRTQNKLYSIRDSKKPTSRKGLATMPEHSSSCTLD